LGVVPKVVWGGELRRLKNKMGKVNTTRLGLDSGVNLGQSTVSGRKRKNKTTGMRERKKVWAKTRGRGKLKPKTVFSQSHATWVI